MPPVEQWPSPTGNPGASLYVRRRHGQRRAGASAATARRAGGGHGASAGSDWRPRAGRRRAPGASRRGCNTDCRDRSGCTRRPGCGTRRTGTDGPEGPTTPPDRAGSAGRSRPSAPHCCGTAFIGTVSGTARSIRLPGKRGPRPCPPSSARLGLYSADHHAPVGLSGRPAGRPDRHPSSISYSARNTASRSRMKAADQIRFLAVTKARFLTSVHRRATVALPTLPEKLMTASFMKSPWWGTAGCWDGR